MIDYEADEIPRGGKKRSGRKRFGIRWTYTGPVPAKSDWFKRTFMGPYVSRYHTERAALQALGEWAAGKGTLGFLCPPTEWKAETFFT